MTRENILNINNLKKLRKKYTIKELVQLCGVGKSTISKRIKELTKGRNKQ